MLKYWRAFQIRYLAHLSPLFRAFPHCELHERCEDARTKIRDVVLVIVQRPSLCHREVSPANAAGRQGSSPSPLCSFSHNTPFHAFLWGGILKRRTIRSPGVSRATVFLFWFFRINPSVSGPCWRCAAFQEFPSARSAAGCVASRRRIRSGLGWTLRGVLQFALARHPFPSRDLQ